MEDETILLIAAVGAVVLFPDILKSGADAIGSAEDLGSQAFDTTGNMVNFAGDIIKYSPVNTLGSLITQRDSFGFVDTGNFFNNISTNWNILWGHL